MLHTTPQRDTGRGQSPNFDEVMRPLTEEAIISESREAQGDILKLNDHLMEVSANGSAEIAQELLGKGANLNYFYNGWTPLKRAIASSNTEMVQLLLENGADSNKIDKWQVTGLMMAVGRRNSEVIHLLLKNGADPNAKDLNRKTALGIAEHLEFDDMVKILEPVTTQSE